MNWNQIQKTQKIRKSQLKQMELKQSRIVLMKNNQKYLVRWIRAKRQLWKNDKYYSEMKK